MEKCDKCGGFIMNDGKEVRCFNCGKRFFQKDKLAIYYIIKCKKCGSEFTAPSKNKKICKKCEKKLYRKQKICIVCGKEFIAKSRNTDKCPDCRTYNRNEDYIRKNRILSYKLIQSKKR